MLTEQDFPGAQALADTLMALQGESREAAQEAMDDLCDDTAENAPRSEREYECAEATQANNDGFPAQVEYLCTVLGTEDALEQIREAVGLPPVGEG